MVRIRLEALDECSFTVHPSMNRYPVATLGRKKAVRKATGYPTSNADDSGKVSSLSSTPLHTKVYGYTFSFTYLWCKAICILPAI